MTTGILKERSFAAALLIFFAIIFASPQLQQHSLNALLRIHFIPELTLVINPDAKLSLYLGNYFFNVYGNGVYDLERAEWYFKKALELDPQVPDAWHQLARIDFLRGDFSKALEKINTQIELHGDSFMASYYIRGLIIGYKNKRSREDLDKAESDFKKFLAWDEKNWAALNDLAWIYFLDRKFAEAENTASKGLVFNSGNPWLLNTLGAALLNQGREKEAVPALEEAMRNAEKLKTEDWHKAYPGNHPDSALAGIESIKKTISENLRTALNTAD